MLKMTENLRKPTIDPTQHLMSPPKMAIVKEEAETEEAETEEVVAGPARTAESEVTETPAVKPRKKRARKRRAVKPKPLSLTSLELMELDLNQARVDMQATVLENLKMKERIINGEYALQRDLLRKKQRDTAVSMEQCKEAYNLTRINIQERLGLSLDNCTVRQDGVIIPIDKEGNPEYVGDGS